MVCRCHKVKEAFTDPASAISHLTSPPSGCINLAAPPDEPPICFRCDGPSKKLITRTSNRNGNAGRPYYKCRFCDEFLAFADDRGNDPANPLCYCGKSSKREVACREKKPQDTLCVQDRKVQLLRASAQRQPSAGDAGERRACAAFGNAETRLIAILEYVVAIK